MGQCCKDARSTTTPTPVEKEPQVIIKKEVHYVHEPVFLVEGQPGAPAGNPGEILYVDAENPNGLNGTQQAALGPTVPTPGYEFDPSKSVEQ